MSAQHDNNAEHRSGSRPRRYALAAVIFIGGAVAGATAVTGAAAHAFGMGGHHGWRHGGEWTADTARARSAEKLAWVLGRVDASDAQTARIQAIVDDAIDTLAPAVARHRASHGRIAELLGAETVDAAALERLRAESLAAMESSSRVLVQALADAAGVLSPEQRRTLIDAVHRHRH